MILVINLGSSSLRFNMFDDSKNFVSVFSGICENIGANKSKIIYNHNGNIKNLQLYFKNHESAFSFVKKILFYPEGPVKSLIDIHAIGHRVVHGGNFFSDTTLIDDNVVKKIRSLIPLAPIHNAVNLEGILDCQIEFPNVPQFAVFDTSFFHNLPEKVKTYPIPHHLSEKYQIRKYGFHGISHDWVCKKYIQLSGNNKCKVISCHLGSGSSICAIKNGMPVETSMGLTPLGGLMMGTRTGSLDPSLVTYLMSQSGMDYNEINEIFNKKSGLLGISDFSNDIRNLLNNKNIKCELALDMFVHRIIKYIGGYVAVLHGVDAIIFTGGIGENSPEIRERICKNFEFIGAKIDKSINQEAFFETEKLISAHKSSVEIYVIKANEELSIAYSVFESLKKCDFYQNRIIKL